MEKDPISDYFKKIIYCRYCGKELKWQGWGFCSKECIRKNKAKKDKLRNDKGKCKQCKKQFYKGQKSQIFCTKECSIVHQRNHQKKNTEIKYFSIFLRDGFSCIYCGKSSIEDKVKLTIDHIIPLALGGKAEMNNIITACMTCNILKEKKILPVDTQQRLFEKIKILNKGIKKAQLTQILIDIENINYRDEKRN